MSRKAHSLDRIELLCTPTRALWAIFRAWGPPDSLQPAARDPGYGSRISAGTATVSYGAALRGPTCSRILIHSDAQQRRTWIQAKSPVRALEPTLLLGLVRFHASPLVAPEKAGPLRDRHSLGRLRYLLALADAWESDRRIGKVTGNGSYC